MFAAIPSKLLTDKVNPLVSRLSHQLDDERSDRSGPDYRSEPNDFGVDGGLVHGSRFGFCALGFSYDLQRVLIRRFALT